MTSTTFLDADVHPHTLGALAFRRTVESAVRSASLAMGCPLQRTLKQDELNDEDQRVINEIHEKISEISLLCDHFSLREEVG